MEPVSASLAPLLLRHRRAVALACLALLAASAGWMLGACEKPVDRSLSTANGLPSPVPTSTSPATSDTPKPALPGQGQAHSHPHPQAVYGQRGSWVYASPFRQEMRLLWVNCGTLAAELASPDPDGFVAHDAADAIRKRAEAMVTRWQLVAEHTEGLASTGPQPDWDATNAGYESLLTACMSCHLEYRPANAFGITPQTLADWSRGLGTRPARANTGTDRHRDGNSDCGDIPKLPQGGPEAVAGGYFHSMNTMCGSTGTILKAIEIREHAGVSGGAGVILTEVEKQIRHWQSVVDSVDALQALAPWPEKDAARAAYQKLTMSCVSCHSAYGAGAGSELTVAPPSWPRPTGATPDIPNK